MHTLAKMAATFQLMSGGRLILSIAELAKFHPARSMRGAKHWVNHLEFNTAYARI